jgi:hypothetical protein
MRFDIINEEATKIEEGRLLTALMLSGLMLVAGYAGNVDGRDIVTARELISNDAELSTKLNSYVMKVKKDRKQSVDDWKAFVSSWVDDNPRYDNLETALKINGESALAAEFGN